ncbi:hypothetical protein LWI29_013175 [Acer saccharum]|uniref:Uncharacterized protein n=1 Tax=Acer saccharum TaxID=4024 RepID=A0AA39VSV5_ACESA|nr:hypothetical protein LWI29_013175 [Acer saccharum]
MFFQRGLNVSLSSDDDLQIQLTEEALVQEYSVATQLTNTTPPSIPLPFSLSLRVTALVFHAHHQIGRERER